MTQTSYPKVGGATTDAQYVDLFDTIIGTGVRDAGDLTVTADSSGLNVKVAVGFAVLGGVAFNSTAVEPLTIAANTSGATRVDTVILRRDSTATNPVSLLVKQGGTTAPTLTQSRTGVWEEPLADVVVANNAATITSANVTDRRQFLGSNVLVWTTARRPVGRIGRFGYNTTLGTWEWHNGTGWQTGLPPATHDINGAAHSGVLGVAKGGTGQSTASAARSALGVAVPIYFGSKPTTNVEQGALFVTITGTAASIEVYSQLQDRWFSV